MLLLLAIALLSTLSNADGCQQPNLSGFNAKWDVRFGRCEGVIAAKKWCVAKCLHGYKGDLYHYTCKEDGTWSIMARPRCRRITGARCDGSKIVIPSNSRWENTCAEILPGEKCVAVCPVGYQGDSLTYTCSDGKMSPPPGRTPALTCEPIPIEFVREPWAENLLFVKSDWAYKKMTSNGEGFREAVKVVGELACEKDSSYDFMIFSSDKKNTDIRPNQNFGGIDSCPSLKSHMFLTNVHPGNQGPFIHELMHTWGTYLGHDGNILYEPEGKQWLAHWWYTILDKQGQLGGFDWRGVYCTTEDGVSTVYPDPSVCVKDADGLYELFYSLNAGRVKTSNDALGHISDYEQVLMGTMLPEDVKHKGLITAEIVGVTGKKSKVYISDDVYKAIPKDKCGEYGQSIPATGGPGCMSIPQMEYSQFMWPGLSCTIENCFGEGGRTADSDCGEEMGQYGMDPYCMCQSWKLLKTNWHCRGSNQRQVYTAETDVECKNSCSSQNYIGWWPTQKQCLCWDNCDNDEAHATGSGWNNFVYEQKQKKKCQMWKKDGPAPSFVVWNTKIMRIRATRLKMVTAQEVADADPQKMDYGLWPDVVRKKTIRVHPGYAFQALGIYILPSDAKTNENNVHNKYTSAWNMNKYYGTKKKLWDQTTKGTSSMSMAVYGNWYNSEAPTTSKPTNLPTVSPTTKAPVTRRPTTCQPPKDQRPEKCSAGPRFGWKKYCTHPRFGAYVKSVCAKTCGAENNCGDTQEIAVSALVQLLLSLED